MPRKVVICLPPNNPDAMTELVPIAMDAMAKQEEKELAEENFQLSQHILGLQPYILIEVTGNAEGDEDAFAIQLQYGGGFTKETAFEFLKAVLNDSEEV